MTIEYSWDGAGSDGERRFGGETVYFRGDGAKATVGSATNTPKGFKQAPRSLQLPTDGGKQGVLVEYDPESGLAHTRVVGPYNWPRRFNWKRPVQPTFANCQALFATVYPNPASHVKCEDTGGAVLGFRVFRVTSVFGPEDSASDIDSLVAPDLNWEQVSYTVTARSSKVIRIKKVASKVVLGEPPAEVFQVPYSARLVPPSEYTAEADRVRGSPVCEKCVHPERDYLYNAVPIPR